jgi:probable rRNA maturation factor
MEILIDNRQTRINIDQQDLLKKAERILEGLACEQSAVLSIALVDSAEMEELNYTYRGKKEPTNVLSFSQIEGEHIGARSDLLGDVVINTDRVVEDAERLDYTREEMALYLLIHGILHLAGYDHSQPQDASVMADKVETIFHGFVEESSVAE